MCPIEHSGGHLLRSTRYTIDDAGTAALVEQALKAVAESTVIPLGR